MTTTALALCSTYRELTVPGSEKKEEKRKANYAKEGGRGGEGGGK